MVWGLAGISTGPLSVSTVRVAAPAAASVVAAPSPFAEEPAEEEQPPSTGVRAAVARKAAKVRREIGAMGKSFLKAEHPS